MSEEELTALAARERRMCPGIGTCKKCQRPWITHEQMLIGDNCWQQLPEERYGGRVGVREHSTTYAPGRGMFPLCEGCWKELTTPENRLPYYKQLWVLWRLQAFQYGHSCEVSWEQIELAVLLEELP